MTKEIKVTISPDDICAADFECKQCGSHFTIKLSEFGDPLARCPICRNEWIPTRGGSTDVAVRNLIGYLKEFSELASDSDKKIGFTLRLELKEETISASAHASSGRD